MSAVAVAIGGSALLGAYTADQAGKRQSDAANQAANRVGQAGIQARADLAPWRDSGQAANARLMELLGLSQPTAAPTREQFTTTKPTTFRGQQSGGFYQPRQITGSVQDSIGDQRGTYIPNTSATTFDQAGYDKATGAYNALQTAPHSAEYGSLLKPFTGADVATEPGYQFGLSEGQKAIDRAASASGRYDSGQTLKELSRYGQDYAGTKYNEAYNRDASDKSRVYGYLSGQSGQGANAAGQQAGIGTSTAMGQGNYQAQGADAAAAGLVGASNALSSGVGSYLGYQSNQQTLDYLKGLRRGSGNGWGSCSTIGTVS